MSSSVKDRYVGQTDVIFKYFLTNYSTRSYWGSVYVKLCKEITILCKVEVCSVLG